MNSSDPKARAFSTDQLRAAFRGDVLPARPAYLTDIVAEAGRTRQRPAWTFLGTWLPADLGKQRFGVPRAAGVSMLTFLLVTLLVTAGVFVGSQTKPAPVDLGIFAPVAGRVVYGDQRGVWGVDPVAPAAPAVRLSPDPSIPLGWSSDGTRLLVMRGSGPVIDPVRGVVGAADERLFVLRADGSETRLTEQPLSIEGASISPDGTRVVFATGTGALYAVDVKGGPADVVVLHPDSGIRAPAYSPDGTRIAFMSGAGDNSNSVWLMNADGTDAHRIVDNESNRQIGHVDGLSWSPAGDRLALGLGGSIYTFASDGSGLTEIVGCHPVDPCSGPMSAGSPYWSPDGARIAYTTGCDAGTRAADRTGCHLAIADADGSNVLSFGSGISGPWHPSRR
jgi:WD40 repeat protein